MATPRIISTSACWLEGEALRQLERSAALPGCRRAVGLPDLHPGKGYPVGAVWQFDNIIYPYLLGNDVGCAMTLFALDLETINVDKLARKLARLDEPLSDARQTLIDNGFDPELADFGSGTIGRGNHFCELQKVTAAAPGLTVGQLVLLVHSGSRASGDAFLRSHVDRFRDGGLSDGTPEQAAWLVGYQRCLSYAEANRFLIGLHACELLGCSGEQLLSSVHNGVERLADGSWLHRKGAAPLDAVMILPGSRGTRTALLAPGCAAPESSLWSVAHGAGRKWGRNECRERLEKRHTGDELRRTALGSRVICGEKELLFQEAPEAYKNHETIISALVDNGHAVEVGSTQPLVTFKAGE